MLTTLFTSSSVLGKSGVLLFCSWAAFMSDGVDHLVSSGCNASSSVKLDSSFFGLNAACWDFFHEARGFELLEGCSDDVSGCNARGVWGSPVVLSSAVGLREEGDAHWPFTGELAHDSSGS